MTGYSDTSFLASLYGLDVNSPAAVREYANARPLLLLTAFGEFELVNAFQACVFRKEASEAEARRWLQSVQNDIDAGVLVRKPVPEAAYGRAIELSRRYTRRIGARALDILHVAIALEVGADVFFTFDRRQHRLARAAGLRIRPAP